MEAVILYDVFMTKVYDLSVLYQMTKGLFSFDSAQPTFPTLYNRYALFGTMTHGFIG